MDRVDTRSGNKEGGAPEMVESNLTPTIPTINLTPYALITLKKKFSQPAPPPASSRARSKGKAAAAAAATSSSRRGPWDSPPKSTQTEEEDAILAFCEDAIKQTEEVEEEGSIREYPFTQTEEEEDANWKKEDQRILPIFLADQAGEPAQLAIEYYKKKEGVQLQLTEMINGCGELTELGLITHLHFKASCGEPSDAPPKTVYAQIHTPGSWFRYCNFEKPHASRVFTHESPLLKDPRFQVHPTNGWIDYPFDCPECGLDLLDGRDGFKGLRLWGI